jgi:thiamine-phosphate pyrophosphorylase
LIINDRLDIAIAAEADGAHLGQDDLPARAARPLLGSCRILGISAGNAKEAATGQSDGADYIGAGPVFEARSTKPDAASPMGLSGLAEICRATTLPVIAIGGINTGNIGPVFEAGAAGVAAISAVLLSEDVESATRALKAAVPTRK